VWYWVSPDPGGYGGFGATEYEEYTGAGPLPGNAGVVVEASATAAEESGVYKESVFPAAGGISGGVPANISSFWPSGKNSFGVPTNSASSWSDVEIKQFNNVVTLSIDKTVLFSYVNTNTATSLSTNGYIMLGFDSPIEGAFQNYLDTPDGAVYYANLTVLNLNVPSITITSIQDSASGGNNSVTVRFTDSLPGFGPSSFTLQSSSSLTAPFAPVSPATITQSGAQAFQATASLPNTAQFFRVMFNNP